MADKPTQLGRAGQLATPFGIDVLLLTRFEGTEALGELFEWRVDAVSDQDLLDFAPHIGKFFSFKLATPNGGWRHFGGVLAEGRRFGWNGSFVSYQLILRPWLWLLSLQAQSRIFKNMKPTQIISQVLHAYKFAYVDSLLSEDYPILEYTVQYRETDLNFVLRLMEKYGIYYYFNFKQFSQEVREHELVLADSSSPLRLPDLDGIHVTSSPKGDAGKQHLVYWGETASAYSEIVHLTDYDYRSPSADMDAIKTNPSKGPSVFSIRDYPGGYSQLAEGETIARVLEEAESARAIRAYATGQAPSLLPGYQIARTSDFEDAPPKDILILRCTHSYGEQTYESDISQARDGGYSGSYEFAPAEQKYRMAPRSRRPVIVGTQPAKVVTEQASGSDADKPEIDVDDDGRILCEFYWAPKEFGPKGEKLPKKFSRRVRVSQFWAGSVRGALFIPRVGDEVVVQYEEGDPDRPIVVGSVYNGNNPINKKIVQKKNQSGLLTRSTPRSTGYNMLLFDDTAGHEKVKLRAQKDLMFKALANEQRDIGANQIENIGGDETINVGDDKNGGNFTINAAKKVTINVNKAGQTMTQIVMDQDSITFNVGPDGAPTQIKMDKQGIKVKAVTIEIEGKAEISAKGGTVTING